MFVYSFDMLQCDTYVVLCLFFFFKQKTAYEMRISDWSSDVCSSDLLHPRNPQSQGADVGRRRKTLRSAYYGADYWPFGDWNANRFGWLAKSYRESFGSSIRRSRSYAGSGKHSCCCVADP